MVSDSLKNSGAIAQLGERLNGIQEVTGSIPVSSTKSQSNGFPGRSLNPLPRKESGFFVVLWHPEIYDKIHEVWGYVWGYAGIPPWVIPPKAWRTS